MPKNLRRVDVYPHQDYEHKKGAIYQGWFHEWGSECSDGDGPYSVAIVEDGEGHIKTPEAHQVKFCAPASASLASIDVAVVPS